MLFKSLKEKVRLKSTALSVLLHGLLIIILIFIKTEFTIGPAPKYTIINFSQAAQPKSSPKVKSVEKPQTKEEKIKVPEKLHEKIQKEEENKITTEIDTTPIQQVFEAPQVTYKDTAFHNLKFAKYGVGCFLLPRFSL